MTDGSNGSRAKIGFCIFKWLKRKKAKADLIAYNVKILISSFFFYNTTGPVCFSIVNNCSPVATTEWSRFEETLWSAGGSAGKESACNVGDPALIPGSRRSSGEGNGNPLLYSCLENPKDGGAWLATFHGVAKSGTWLRDSHFHSDAVVHRTKAFTHWPFYRKLPTLALFYLHKCRLFFANTFL